MQRTTKFKHDVMIIFSMLLTTDSVYNIYSSLSGIHKRIQTHYFEKLSLF